jgi:hypothetical protein
MAVSLLEIDLRERTLTFRTSDGRAMRTSMPSDMFSEPSNLERVELDVESAQLAVSMAGEERAVIEFCRPGQSVEQLRAGRPAVYLDQNHWSTIPAARHGHRPVRPQEKQAALRLAELAESGQILLPVSAAHLVETTPMHGAPRVAMAGTVLALGRGWQMRNPLHVRVEEMLRTAGRRRSARRRGLRAGRGSLLRQPAGTPGDAVSGDGARAAGGRYAGRARPVRGGDRRASHPR